MPADPGFSLLLARRHTHLTLTTHRPGLARRESEADIEPELFQMLQMLWALYSPRASHASLTSDHAVSPALDIPLSLSHQEKSQ